LDFLFQDGSEAGTAGNLVVSGDTVMTCTTPVVAQAGQTFLRGLLGDGETRVLLAGGSLTFQ
jgi:hypothetical protein